MVAAINLDNKLMAYARKVCEERANGVLPAELETAKLLAAQHNPQQLLGLGFVASERSRTFY